MRRQPLNGPACEGSVRWEKRAGRSVISVFRDRVIRAGHHTSVGYSVYLDGKRVEPGRVVDNPAAYDERREDHALGLATLLWRALTKGVTR